MTRKLLLAAALLAGFSGSAAAVDDGLVRECALGTRMCDGYIVGVTDMARITKAICIPKGTGNIDGGYLRRYVLQYFYGHPQHWHLTNGEFVLQALKDAWPCMQIVSEPVR
jgi:Ssp1 endopeptidase immunity protein Rap1a